MRYLRWWRYFLLSGTRWGRQTCEDCWRDGRTALWFYVPTPVWDAIRGDRHVLCLTCFDRRAERLDLDYSKGLVVEGRCSWLTGQHQKPWPAEMQTFNVAGTPVERR